MKNQTLQGGAALLSSISTIPDSHTRGSSKVPQVDLLSSHPRAGFRYFFDEVALGDGIFPLFLLDEILANAPPDDRAVGGVGGGFDEDINSYYCQIQTQRKLWQR